MANAGRSQAEEVNEFILRECRTEFDAAHPRFVDPDEAEEVKFQTEHDFYCEACRLFFAPTVEALKVHFKGDLVEHKPYGVCLYCKGHVYSYKLNERVCLYHICTRKK